jgi:tetratricopeptide (TPR) repeat protein
MESSDQNPSQEVLAKADAMDDAKEFVPLFAFLQEQSAAHPDNYEIMWRLARSHFDMSSEEPSHKKEHLIKAHAISKKLFDMQPDNYLTHKWYAIILSSLSDFRSTKEKIQESVLIKEHALKAIELHGKGGDQTLNHLLGRWCYAVASVSWMERKLASAIFATPPESSYDEALKYFLNAEAIHENDDFLENLIWTANTYHKLSNNDKAKEYYAKAAAVTPRSTSDIALVKEAKQKHSRL